MASNKTVVKGLRASQEFFDKCDLVAKAEGVDRNKLIVRVVSEHCENYTKPLITEWEENYVYVAKPNVSDNNEHCEYPFVECKYLGKENGKSDLVEKVEND